MTPVQPSLGKAPAPLLSIKAQAYDGFQTALLSGRVKPGQFLSQKDMVDILGVSLGAVRELLPRLEAEGLLSVLPQRGIQVTSVDMQLIRNAFQFRLAIEREAVLTAITKLSDEVLLEQERLHRHILDRAAKEGITPALLTEAQAVDTGLHKTLVEATANDLLINAYSVNAIRVRLINVDRMQLSEEVLEPAFTGHLEIIGALRKRDAARAIDAIERHIRSARDRAVKF